MEKAIKIRRNNTRTTMGSTHSRAMQRSGAFRLLAVENAVAHQRFEGVEVPPDVVNEMKRVARGEIGIEEGIRNTVRQLKHDEI